MNVYWSQMMMVMVVVVRATRGVPVFVLLQRGRTTAACWLAGPLIISQTLMRLSLLTSRPARELHLDQPVLSAPSAPASLLPGPPGPPCCPLTWVVLR